MKSILICAAVLAALVAGGLGATALAASDPPPGDTIVRVEGDKANGFSIYRYDGSEQFPPTDSEARAECGEYDTRVQRVRCRTEVRTWYRDLRDLREALDWAHQG